MGVAPNIGHDAWPKQGAWLNARVGVCFHYDTARIIEGTVVRDDAESPHRTVIRLDDGRVVLSTECQFTVLAPA